MTNPLVHILLVDDDEDYHVITRDLLGEIRETQFELTSVATYEEGLQAISRQQHDVYLIDYRLGARNGLELIREALALRCRAPFILMTGQGDHEVDIEAMQAGAADYLVKGEIDAGTLERSIRYSIERARASEERFRSAFDQAVIGMALISTDGHFLQVNGSLCEMLNVAPHELMGTSFQVITHPEDRSPALEVLNQIQIGERASCQLEMRYLRKGGGEVWVLFSASIVRDTQGRPLHFISQIQNITPRKQAEEALVQSEAQLRQAQKMEAIGRLAGGVAHDFNNILTAVKGYSEQARKLLHPDDLASQHIHEVEKAAERAASLTRQLLAFSRKQTLQPKVIDLNAVVVEMDKMLRRLIGEDIDLVSFPCQTLGHVRADPGQIEQVLMNLAVNARDAMPDGGKLTIQTGNVTFDDSYCQRHPEVTPSAYVMLAMSDNGTGMTTEVKSRLFEPFFTTKGTGKGTGLGLATCFGIVKQSGGHISVYSELGCGTTFKIYLPCVEHQVETPKTVTESTTTTGGHETVLLVEDEPAVRELASLILGDLGYRVMTASNGMDALEVIRTHDQDHIDLLLTDVVMPEMGGKELADRLSSTHNDLRILFTSGYTAEAIAHRGVLEPGIDFLQKPYSSGSLARKVREVLDN